MQTKLQRKLTFLLLIFLISATAAQSTQKNPVKKERSQNTELIRKLLHNGFNVSKIMPDMSYQVVKVSNDELSEMLNRLDRTGEKTSVLKYDNKGFVDIRDKNSRSRKSDEAKKTTSMEDSAMEIYGDLVVHGDLIVKGNLRVEGDVQMLGHPKATPPEKREEKPSKPEVKKEVFSVLHEIFGEEDSNREIRGEHNHIKTEEELEDQFLEELVASLERDLQKAGLDLNELTRQAVSEVSGAEIAETKDSPASGRRSTERETVCRTREQRCTSCSAVNVACMPGEMRTGGGCKGADSLRTNSASLSDPKSWLCESNGVIDELSAYVICCN
eukprot:TRINITY_DN4612_c0_g1_i1.p1 TRINITY_DN4612_c0_g1~~TRINITY_DN4612_c0_g1_i1.p1  ORF type:complete len:329 (-),score=39.70 TRINITY_DN4612_c0_g1_i1:25-1011(-)